MMYFFNVFTVLSQSLYASKINRLVHTYVSAVRVPVPKGPAESQSFNPMSIRMTKRQEG